MADVNSPTASEVYREYLLEEETYKSAAQDFLKRVTAILAESSIDTAIIEARAKKPLELFKKQRRKRYVDPWAECPDLVGARVVVPLDGDKARVVEAVQASSSFTAVDVEDQSVGADPDTIAYRGLHLHLKAGLQDSKGRPIACELQVRTIAEHSWAMTQHSYVYKKVAGLPYEIQRTFARLLVLVELYDRELSRGVDMVKSFPGYSEMLLVLNLEERFESLTGRAGDQETTREIVELISTVTDTSATDLRGLLDDFLDAHSASALELIVAHGPESTGFDVDEGWLMSQPEVLLILAMLDRDEYSLSNAISGTDMYRYVEPIALWSNHPGFVR